MMDDGLGPAQLTVSDLVDVYWTISKNVLFTDDPEAQGVTALFGDFSTSTDMITSNNLMEASPDLITSNHLMESFNIVSAQTILHCLSKDQVLNFLSNAMKCLKPNGILFGNCVTSALEPTEWGITPTIGLELDGRAAIPRYLHSQSSLETLLSSLGFINIRVSLMRRVETSTNLLQSPGDPDIIQKTFTEFICTKPL